MIKACAQLKEGDEFNVIVVDSKIKKMSPKSIKWNKNSPKEAAVFLQKHEYLGHLKNKSPYKVFQEVYDENSKLPQTIIYLSDGNSLKTIQKDCKNLKALTSEGSNSFSLYTAAASQGNNLPMLKLLSSLNKGELMHSPTHAAFPRKLARLVKHVDRIFAKDLRVLLKTEGYSQVLQLNSHLPNFFQDRPYVIYGKVDNLQDFELHIQGKMHGKIFSHTQKISFENAKSAGYQLQKNYSTKQADVCFEYFLTDSNPIYLREAKKILEPFNIELPCKL
ncbi:MAG: hypothetical protein KAR79_03420 [Simkaniaceae bacterium]|nr:hypothetical protein [Simkaniaceae bacterium]